ncbi:MAG: protoporphyrinogen oxidase [Anaerolineaceae bacterium]|nr:protoporphyrinogen oxidase [Anaerolineaceae bacterium]
MEGTKESIRKQIVVVGAGISGLSAAYYLQKAVAEQNLQADIILAEAGEHIGGKIKTDYVEDFVIEGGPDCFLRQKPWAYQLAKELGIETGVIGTNDERRKTFVLDKQKLVPLPDGVMLIIPTKIKPFLFSPLFSWPGKLRMGLDLLIPKFVGDEDESIGQFVRRRLGKEALEKLAEPLLSGIHVSDPEKQSLLATFPRFRNLEKKHGSLIMGMLAAKRHPAPAPSSNGQPKSLFLSFKEGMGYFVQQLELSLNKTTILKNKKLLKLTPGVQHRYQLIFEDKTEVQADAVVLAVPSFAAAEILSDFSDDLYNDLLAIPYVSTATISLAYPKSAFPKGLEGFGFLVPRTENRQITACTWSSIKFNHRANEEHILMRCFIGGPGKEEQVDWNDAAVRNVIQSELKDLLGITAAPLFMKIYRWEKANPQYEVGHLNLVKQIKQLVSEKAPYVYLAGSAFEGVGIPDCVRQGKESALSLITALFETEVLQ